MGLTTDKIAAGATLDLRVTLTAYPAPDWSLALILRGPQAIDIAATADGASHRIQADAATSADWMPGKYWFALRATRGGDVVQVDEGDLQITPDLAAVSEPFDGRTHAERVLAAIEAVIEGRATIDQQSYQINNRQLSRTPIPDLLKLRNEYRAEVRQQRLAERGQSLLGRQIKVRFC